MMGHVSRRARVTDAFVALAVGGLVGCGTGESSAPTEMGSSEGTSVAGSSGSEPTGTPMGSTGGTRSTSEATGGAGSDVSSGTGSQSSGSGGGPTEGDCIESVRSGHRVLDCGHLSFDVSVPEGCVRESCGMIVDVHGLTMSAQMQEANTRLMALGLERSYVVIQPNAIPEPPVSSWDGAADDLTVVAFVEEAIEDFGIDVDRVHLTGFSQGGLMTWRLLESHGELWASAAPAAACGMGLPSTVVPLLYMHGTTDALVGFECAEPRVQALLEHYGIEGEGTVVDSSDDHVRLRYGEQGPALVEFLSHDYDSGNAVLGGHCYPGSQDPGRAPGQLFTYACGGDEAFVWGESAIDFFDAHPRLARASK